MPSQVAGRRSPSGRRSQSHAAGHWQGMAAAVPSSRDGGSRRAGARASSRHMTRRRAYRRARARRSSSSSTSTNMAAVKTQDDRHRQAAATVALGRRTAHPIPTHRCSGRVPCSSSSYKKDPCESSCLIRPGASARSGSTRT